MRLTLDAVEIDAPSDHIAEARRFYAARAAGRGPGSVEELTAVRARRSPAPPSEPPADEELITFDGALADIGAPRTARTRIPIRIFQPPTDQIRGVYLDIHGGGFYMDSAARNDVQNRRLADELRIAVVSVDYRLAPEHPWPAAPDDCAAVALWLVDHAAGRFGSSRLALGGSSAGATLALTTALRLRDTGAISQFVGAALQFGTYDLSARTPAGRLIADEYFIQAYAGHVKDRTHPDISPIYADLQGLPPALVVVGSRDVLLEDNLAMAGRLAAAGNDGELRVYPESPHGFTGHPTAIAETALRDITSWLDTRFAHEPRAVTS